MPVAAIYADTIHALQFVLQGPEFIRHETFVPPGWEKICQLAVTSQLQEDCLHSQRLLDYESSWLLFKEGFYSKVGVLADTDTH